MLEARRNKFGLLDEAQLAAGNYPLPELGPFSKNERATLLDAAIVMFLKHNLCFRKSISDNTCIIFPSLISQKRPAVENTDTVDDVSYYVTGQIETLYSALVVQLGHTGAFSRADHWRNQAQYEVRPGQLCGFRQIESHEGTTEFVLYYSRETPEDARSLFRLLFERFLDEQGADVMRYYPLYCPNCGYLQDRNEVFKRIREGKSVIGCANACGAVIELSAATREPSASGSLQPDRRGYRAPP